MREEEIDKILKDKMYSKIKAPESLKNRISNEIRNTKNTKQKKHKFKIMQSIAAVVVFSMIGVSTYAAVTKNPILEKLGFIKGSTTYEETAKEVNKDISNEYANITLQRMAADSTYIIMEYNIKINEKGIEKFGKISTDESTGADISIINTIAINDNQVDNGWNKIEYSNKISDTEYEIYQIIDIRNISDKKLNIKIKNEYLEANSIKTEINRTIAIEGTKAENIFEKIESKIGNKTFTIENFQNTSFETFIKISVEIENITEEDIEDFYSENNPNNIWFTVLDEQDNYIPNRCYVKKSYLKDHMENIVDILGTMEEGYIDYGSTKAYQEYIITLGDINKELNEIKVIPYICVLRDDRAENYNEYYDNLEWYKISDSSHSNKNSFGGEIKINDITVTDEKIRFSYDLSGFVTGREDEILVRIVGNPELGFNFMYPTDVYTKNINSQENYIEFDRTTGNAGIYTPLKTEEDNEFYFAKEFLLEDITQVEYTLFAEPIMKLLGIEQKITITEEQKTDFIIDKIEEIEDNSEERFYVNLYDNSETNSKKIERENIEEKFGEQDNQIGGIRVGMTESQIESILGKPINRIETDSSTGKELTCDFENMCIHYNEKHGEYVSYVIYMWGEGMKGPRDIEIGDTKQEVIDKFYIEEEITVVDDIRTLYEDENGSGTNGYHINSNGEFVSYSGDGIQITFDLDENQKVKEMVLTHLETDECY